jgi:hypothetical protein
VFQDCQLGWWQQQSRSFTLDFSRVATGRSLVWSFGRKVQLSRHTSQKAQLTSLCHTRGNSRLPVFLASFCFTGRCPTQPLFLVCHHLFWFHCLRHLVFHLLVMCCGGAVREGKDYNFPTEEEKILALWEKLDAFR